MILHPRRPEVRTVLVTASSGALLVLLAGGLAPPTGAAELSAGGELSYGSDSNPLELPGGEISGAFTEAAFRLSGRAESGRAVGLMARAAGVRRWYASRVGDAGYGWADARAGMTAAPYRNGSRRFELAFGASLGAYRTTLIDPDTGEAYGRVAGSSASGPIPDRLDFNSSGAFLELRWSLGRDLLLYAEGEWSRRNFVQDYRGEPGLESLDDRGISVEPGLRYRPVRGLILDLSHTWNRRSYEELPALDGDAVPVAGEQRELAASRTRLTVSCRPEGPWEVLAGIRQTGREDLHAGYYDSTGREEVLAVGYMAGASTRLGLVATRRSLNYRRALVDNDPSGEIRSGRVHRYAGEVSHRLTAQMELFVTAGTERSENRDPAYVYSRSWAQTGLRMEL